MNIAYSLAKILVKRPKTVLLVFTVITILVGLQIRNVYMQSDLTAFLPRKSYYFTDYLYIEIYEITRKNEV